jgi:heme/copper-type cytochrome/quinol oxidase subunit 3
MSENWAIILAMSGMTIYYASVAMERQNILEIANTAFITACILPIWGVFSSLSYLGLSIFFVHKEKPRRY